MPILALIIIEIPIVIHVKWNDEQWPGMSFSKIGIAKPITEM